VGHKPIVRIFPVDDPTAYARTLFIEVLRREGVRVRASSLARPDAPLPEKETLAKLPRVACFTSPPLAEALKVTLKVSHNLYASTLPLLLAVKDGNRTLTAGLRGQGRVLKELGLDIATISFGGGAGGDNADRATPRATVELLRAMAKRSDWKVYKEALPILGVDGTLATVVSKDSPARGKVFAKTGTLTWSDRLNGRNLLRSKALAGVMESPRGELLFAFFVNDVPLPPSVTSTREGKALGRLCELFFEKE
jgi:D-alanyl-D-alanine carboxypeptidase/D-alanyl-D-alanine-endopeptidase (penicillin-binding protein 4)